MKQSGLPSDQTVLEPRPEKLYVFLSYGHDEYVDVAKQLKRDLEERGHEVRFDEKKLKVGKSYEKYIDGAIKRVNKAGERGRILLLMTPHSVGRPAGFCLSELARADDLGLKVVPMMVAQVGPPLFICRIQWLDIRDCIPLEEKVEQYDGKFKKLVKALETDSFDFEGSQARVLGVLNPLCYRADFRHHIPRFTGREWLFEQVDSWFKDEKAGRVFWITGDAGVGKSAIASVLCNRYSDIMAFHACSRYNKDSYDTKRTILSIAYQLSTQLPGLLEKLDAIGELEKVCASPGARGIFERLIANPLHEPPIGRSVVILIDGLDEATDDGKNELTEFLADEMENFPEWIRFILTSRPDQAVIRPLQAYKPVKIAARSDKNRKDILRYLREQLRAFESDLEKLETAIEYIADQGEVLFLYMEEIRKQIKEDKLSLSRLEEFPKGLEGIYLEYFKYWFGQMERGRYKKAFRPVFSAIAAAYDPLPMALLAEIFGWNPDKVDEMAREWGAFFPVEDNKVSSYHRAIIDWLTDKNRVGSKFHIKTSEGHDILADAGWEEYQKGVKQMSEYFTRHLPAHLRRAGKKEKLRTCITDCAFICKLSELGRLYEISSYWKEIDEDALRQKCRESWEETMVGSKPYLSLAAKCLGKLFQHHGDYRTALYYFENELLLAEADEAEEARGEAIYNIAWCNRHTDDFDTAIAKAKEAEEIFNRTGNMAGVAQCLSVKGMCHWHRQEDMVAIRELQRSIELLRGRDDFRSLAEVSNHLGIVYRSVGQYEKAMKCLEESKEIYKERLRDRKGLGKCVNSIGTCEWWSGHPDQALDNYRKANEINEDINAPYILGLTANNMGYIYLKKKKLKRAKAAFSKAYDLRKKLDIKSYSMMDLSGLAVVHFEMGKIKKAKKLTTKVMKTLEKGETVEDKRRAYYNHWLIMKGGSDTERESAVEALTKGRKLLEKRLQKIEDEQIHKGLTERVPLVKEMLGLEKEAE